MMLDISKFSDKFDVRALGAGDVQAMCALASGNPLFYQFTDSKCTKESFEADLVATPPGKELSDKYFVGFFSGGALVAMLDLVAGYPDKDTAYIGLFMIDSAYQGKGLGFSAVNHLCKYLKSVGFTKVRLAYETKNPQSSHFWHKCGFADLREAQKRTVAEKVL